MAITHVVVLNSKHFFCDRLSSGLNPKTSLVINQLLSGITKGFGMTTIISTRDMSSVVGIGEHITFIYQGHVEWMGNKDNMTNSDNKKLNDLAFASNLFKKMGQTENEK